MKRILVVEDEPAIAFGLQLDLKSEGYDVEVESDGESALQRVRNEAFDLILLDVMLPSKDGFEVCRELRRGGSKTPVIMLTAKTQEAEKVLGLEIGADDYVTKPFSVREVLARVKAILRRVGDQGQSPAVSVLRVGELEVDVERYETKVKGRNLVLTTKEFDFLKCLLQAGGRAMSRDALLEKIWGYDRSMEIDTRTIDQHIARLREKLGSEGARIVTVKNVGYRIKLD